MDRSNTPRIAFIGFGEAGQAVAAGLREEGVASVAAWDILFPQDAGTALRRQAQEIGVRLASSAEDAVRDADIVVSAVTAASSLAAAQSVGSHLRNDAFFLDINSVSPGRKRKTAELLNGAARYVDVAVLAPIHPKRHQTPMLLAGPHARAVAPILSELGMTASIAGDAIGAAAAIKMVRSVMIKGMEALTLECFLAASRAGVADEVAASLHNNYPGIDWDKMIAYNLERMASHGLRRAAEMEESADTLRELGLVPLMTQATVARQREMGELGRRDDVRAAKTQDRAVMLEAVSKAMKEL